MTGKGEPEARQSVGALVGEEGLKPGAGERLMTVRRGVERVGPGE